MRVNFKEGESEMKINKLTINSFRGLKTALFDGLTRMNYVVGENNSGKTSVLEAIVTGGCYSDINMLVDTVFARNQKRFLEGARNMLVPQKGSNSSILVEFDDDHTISTDISCVEDEKIVQNDKGVQKIKLLTVNFSCEDITDTEKKPVSFWFNFEHTSQTKTTIRRDPSISQKNLRNIPCQFVSFSRFDRTDKILEALDNIFVNNQRGSLLKVLQIFDPDVINFEVVGTERQIMVFKKQEDHELALYLNDYGNGMYKAFYIACTALLSENGILLLDELEAGIHHKALVEFVSFLDEISKEKNIQLFITTHSLELLDIAGGTHNSDSMNVYNIKMKKENGNTIVKLLKKEDFDYLRNELEVDVR